MQKDGTTTLAEEPLSIEDLDAYYGKARVLFGVTLRVTKNEVTALLGRNGAGKSTLFKSIIGASGIRKRGKICLTGRDVSGLSPHELAALGVILVPEDRRIFASLSVRRNIELGRVAAAAGRRAALTVERVVEMLPKLDSLLDRRGNELSGGEQQMVAIGRALAGNPGILLMDEPSTGLAPVVLDDLKASISRLASKGTMTVLMSEQNSAFALRLCTRVTVIDRGRIVFSGTKEEFIGSPEISARYLAL